MKSVKMFGGIDYPLPESSEDISDIVGMHEPHIRNLRFYQKATGPISNKRFHILIEFVKNGNNGVYQAYWLNGTKVELILSTQWSFDQTTVNKDPKAYDDIESVFNHALIGIIDYMNSVLLFDPVVKVSGWNLKYIFLVEPDLYRKLSSTIKFLRQPKRCKCVSPHLFGSQILLWDQNHDTKFEIDPLDIYNERIIWNKKAIYAAREDCYEMAMGYRQALHTVKSLDEMLCTRNLNVLRSDKRIDIEKCRYDWLEEYDIKKCMELTERYMDLISKKGVK